jgi:hypothetical protein
MKVKFGTYQPEAYLRQMGSTLESAIQRILESNPQITVSKGEALYGWQLYLIFEGPDQKTLIRAVADFNNVAIEDISTKGDEWDQVKVWFYDGPSDSLVFNPTTGTWDDINDRFRATCMST